MPWVKLDDSFFDHPKVLDLGKDAKLLHLAALAYCSSQLTDGRLSSGAVRLAAAKVDVDQTAIDELVEAGLWEVNGDGYAIHDYLDYNPPGAARAARRTPHYREWREAVIRRDGRRCQQCGDADCLHAHHIRSFALHTRERFEVSNGLTLCATCHREVHRRMDG